MQRYFIMIELENAILFSSRFPLIKGRRIKKQLFI